MKTLFISLCALIQCASALSLENLRVEHRTEPVGIDLAQPRFSWQIIGDTQGLRQTAYQLKVTSGTQAVWDTDWVQSDQSLLVKYEGKALLSSTPYHWQVRIKYQTGTSSPWSKPARWVTGLLDPKKELTADWIGFDQPSPDQPDFSNWFQIEQAHWICHPKQKAKDRSIAHYRTEFNFPKNATKLQIGIEMEYVGQVSLNGIELFQAGRLTVPSYFDLTPWVQVGKNTLVIRVNSNKGREQFGLIAELRTENADGTVTRKFTDGTWETTFDKIDAWSSEKPKAKWVPVRVLGKPGEKNPTGLGKDSLFLPKFKASVFMPPLAMLRKEIELTKPVRFAVFHGTAKGLYDLHVNGKAVTPTGFQPGWTQYEKQTNYVSTDLTDSLKPGKNVLGAVLADGWYRGHLLWSGRERFGDKLRFSGQLEVEYEDGTRATFATDKTWKASYGPTLQSDILMGEIYDARLAQPGWSQPDFDDRAWKPVVVDQRDGNSQMIQRAHPTESVRPEMELSPKAITEPKPGVYVFDFGQNFAGWTRLRISGEPGQHIYLRFGEDLNTDGTIFTDNLRSINPADLYICHGVGVEIWEPRFTYHGFRYVQIVGLKQKPTQETLTGIVAHSGGPITSSFSSSSPMLDRLYQNVQWSQRSNYFETMTDCPQRDERYGWTGDAHFFMGSSAYNQNGTSFFNKWFQDCLATQKPKSGNISNGAPGNKPGAGNGSLDWSAAMIITPWMIWNRFGDTQPILENYDALRLYMTQWEALPDKMAPSGKGSKKDSYKIIGDWVSLEKGTTKEFIGRVMGYQLSKQMVDFATLKGNQKDLETFTALAGRYRSEIIAKHIDKNGKVTGDTQCAYAYVARLGLYEPHQKTRIREQFRRRMEADQFTVQTGFHGTPNLLQGLTKIGLNSEAGKVIMNERSPSWGAMVNRGATTIWERWEGKNADGTFSKEAMNSFNHYTFGGCGEWMMGYLTGLRPDSPGFKTILVKPTVIPQLDHVTGSFETPYGTVSNQWKREGENILMELIVPPNSSARVVLPTGEKKVGSGTHHFEWKENR
ncbi:family 78 glycoside hydrolase catalytic domain [Akkermansiaceae bacterium]|nr:family 78 glycoside hydrolase catalytic domain [Akkermansiaceae bacterium]